MVICFAVFSQSVSAQTILHDDIWSPIKSGDPNAIAKIEVFYDLQCSSCATFHSILKRAEGKFKTKVFITFRYFPLRIPAHDKTFLASRVVEAAHAQSKGRQMLDMVMENQRAWTTEIKAKTILFRYATKLRLNMQRFRDDFEKDDGLNRITGDLLRANELKLDSTPTVFLSGKELTFAEAQDIEAKIANLVR